jgi:hypothetical protein
MKRFGLIGFIVLCFIKEYNAQNLVPNPSFEIHTDCNSARLDNAIGWNSVNTGIGICAYLQTCQTNQLYTAPKQYLDNCFKGYQTIRSGNSYAEFVTYPQTSGTPESTHPSIKLTDTLETGKIYCVTYYISLFNNSVYSIDKLGALFTPTPFPYYVTGTSTPTFSMAGLYNPQIVTTPGVVFEDTLGWEEVSGTFTAVGDEAYLTLGDFFLHSQHFIKNSYPNCNGLAEYYVDDVSVEVVEIAKAKNDTLIYSGDSVLVGANNSEAAVFNWQPTTSLSCTNCPNPKASPNVTTTYTVTKTQCKAVTTDVITVTVSPVGINELNIINAITLQPNPSNGLVTFTSRYDMQRIEVMNVAGQILLSATVNAKEHQLQLESFAEGIYFVRVSYANGQNVSKKIVKQ